MSDCIECPDGSKLCGDGVGPDDCGDGFETLDDGTKCPKNYVFHCKIYDEDGYQAVFKHCTKELYRYFDWNERYRNCDDCD